MTIDQLEIGKTYEGSDPMIHYAFRYLGEGDIEILSAISAYMHYSHPTHLNGTKVSLYENPYYIYMDSIQPLT